MTKIEEVARAIRLAVPHGFPLSESLSIELAKTAIQAMREPTDEMLTAGYHAQSEATRYSLADAHQAMIDQVLAEDGK